MAVKYGVKYIETSPGINHNVDELLVGMLAQIELRAKLAASTSANSSSASSPAAGVKAKLGGFKAVHSLFERVWKGTTGDSKAKSCGNLHVL